MKTTTTSQEVGEIRQHGMQHNKGHDCSEEQATPMKRGTKRVKRFSQTARYWIGIGLACLLWASGYQAEAARLKFRGYAESRYSFLYGLDLGAICTEEQPEALQALVKSLCDPHILINRVVPSFKIPFGRKVRVRVTANLTTTHFKLDREITKIDDILVLQRMYFDLRTKYVDFRLGLQAVQWGTAQLWQLTAPFNPQDATDPNAEIPGVWGINAYVPYSDTGGFRAGVVAARDFQSVLSYLRWKHTFGTTQVAATVLYDGPNKRMTFGTDIKGNLEVGFWIDAALYVPYESEKPEDMWISGAVAVGIDYSFKVLESLYFSLQYYYTYAGITDPAKYPFRTEEGLNQLSSQFTNPSQGASVTGIGISSGGFLGAHYLLFNARLQILEELSVSTLMLMNLIDPSAMLGLTIAYTFFDNFTFTAGSYFFVGPEGSEFNVGRIKLPDAVSAALPGYPSDGIALSPRMVFFGWLRYSF